MEVVGNLSDNSTFESGLVYKQGYPTIITFILAYGFSFVLCVAGNLAVCVIVIKYQQLHTVTNFFIFNLAAADLLVALFCMPFTLVNNILADWIFGDVVCKLSPFMQGVSVAASVFTLVKIRI
ncbi:neuropeptide FF receptor 2-like [Branchiostoma floridae]|uniref:Neuropeptide FF receptor 2-like n=1 Tax=Branchiostoma floridae TaxID=7739 RepID=A0A9J7KT71_BRAFL|nr:neuropeptide FF receptor 2-like [Branchiostoma floridae]